MAYVENLSFLAQLHSDASNYVIPSAEEQQRFDDNFCVGPLTFTLILHAFVAGSEAMASGAHATSDPR